MEPENFAAEIPERNDEGTKHLRTKSKTSGYVIRGTAVAVLFSSSVLIFASALRLSSGPTPNLMGNVAEQSAMLVPGERIEPVSISLVDFQKLAEEDEKAARLRPANEPPVYIEIPEPKRVPEPKHSPAQRAAAPLPAPQLAPPVAAPQPTHSRWEHMVPPEVVPALSFLAQEDGAVAGTNIYVVPPDTTGAVGPDTLFVTLNRNYRVQDKSTGAILSEVSGNTFWASTGTTYHGDPRVVFDPYNNRYLVSSLGGEGQNHEARSILVGVSSTSNPRGTWRLFRFIAGCEPGAPGCDPNGESPDFDQLGFNKNWVVVQWRGQPSGRKLLVLDYPTLRAGTANATRFTIPYTYPGNDVTPATTLSPTEEILYLPGLVSSSSATYRLHSIVHFPFNGEPRLLLSGTDKARPGGGWANYQGQIMPQTCIGVPGVTCPAMPLPLDSGDDRFTNVVFRNGTIWSSQKIGLPAGQPTHTAVQWTRMDNAGNFVDGGRIEDPTATSSNGEWYSQPSIAVNANNDVLLGFSNFSRTHFANTGYAFRFGTDPLGTIRSPIVVKQGEDYYHRNNRWGDYSHTVVDPANDLDMWTIQEYAQTRLDQNAEQENSSSRWSTWWAKVCNSNVSYVITANAGVGGAVTGGGPYPCGSNVMLIATPDNYHTFIGWTEGGKIVSTSYEAESRGNTLLGGAVRQDCFSCSGGRNVGYVGSDAGTLQFNGINAETGPGSYRLTIYYVNGDPTVRTAYLSVNGGAGTPLNFPSTGSFDTVGSIQTVVNLNAGNSNTLKFYNQNSGSWAPDFDRIGVNVGANYSFVAGTSRTLLAHFAAIPPPGVTTSPATSIASYSATMNGSVNPHGAPTSVYFEYGTTTSYGHITATHTYNGITEQNVSANISGLAASTTYHFRTIATNIAGTTLGGDRTFTTLSASGPPITIANSATLVATFSATLNGSVDPHGLTTTVYFQYGTTTSYGLTTPTQSKSGNAYQNVAAIISGLTASTMYHFRIVATNSAGTTYGTDRTFTTLSATGPPVVITYQATNVASSSATLDGSVDPHGLTSTVYFQYGTTTSYGHTTTSQTKTGNTYQGVSANISGLAASTTYHFRIVATNSAGTRYGGDRTFTTTR